MANETQQLTVADLEAAKDWHTSEAIDSRKHEKENKMYTIAATCIGIVEELVKIPDPSNNGNVEIVMSNAKDEDAIHIVALHNIWLKAVDAFGGEVE